MSVRVKVRDTKVTTKAGPQGAKGNSALIDWTTATDLANTADVALAIGGIYRANTSGGSKSHDLPLISTGAENDNIWLWLDFETTDSVGLRVSGSDVFHKANGSTDTTRFVTRAHGPTRITIRRGAWVALASMPL